jgi:hypothetical protein
MWVMSEKTSNKMIDCYKIIHFFVCKGSLQEESCFHSEKYLTSSRGYKSNALKFSDVFVKTLRKTCLMFKNIQSLILKNCFSLQKRL